MNDPLDIKFASDLQQVERAFDICADIRRRSMVRIRDGNKCCQMENNFNLLHGPIYTISISNIAGDNLNIVTERRLIKPSPTPLRIIMNQGASIGSPLH